MDPELAGVVQAEDLDRAEVRLEQRPVLVRRVLADVPGVVGLLGALGRQREPVRGRDVGDRRGGCDRVEQLVDRLDVLDRLQEDDRVARARDVLDQVALEAKVGLAGSAPGVLVGLRVGVDADHVGGAGARAGRSRSPRRRPGR